MGKVIKTRKTAAGTQRAHKHGVAEPMSCSTEATKVENLRLLVKDVEEQLVEAEELAAKMKFYATGELVAAVVMETSIGFLDLAAAAFSVINPAASKAARGGVFAIKSTETIGQVTTGEITKAQAAGKIADNAIDTAVKVAEPKSLQGKVLLSKSKMAYDAALLGIKSATGTSREEMQKEGWTFAKDQATGNAGLIADGLKDAQMDTAGSVLKGLLIVEEMYEAANNYDKALEKRFDKYIQTRENDKQRAQTIKMTLRNTLSSIRDRLDRAVAQMEACELSTVEVRML